MTLVCAIEEDLRINCGDEYPTAGISTIGYIVPVNAIDESGVTADASKHSFTAFPIDTLKWSPIELKINTGALTAENAKDGGGNVFNYNIEGFIPNNTPERSAKLEALNGQRVCVLIPLNTRDANTKQRLAKVVGYDTLKGTGAGAHLNFNDTIEAESGGQNGYAIEITAEQGESSRFADFKIDFEDGSTGGEVKFGSFSGT